MSRLSEIASCISCLFNAFKGGERELTYSQQSYYNYLAAKNERELVEAIDRILSVDNLWILGNKPGHCKKSWEDYLKFYNKITSQTNNYRNIPHVNFYTEKHGKSFS